MALTSCYKEWCTLHMPIVTCKQMEHSVSFWQDQYKNAAIQYCACWGTTSKRTWRNMLTLSTSMRDAPFTSSWQCRSAKAKTTPYPRARFYAWLSIVMVASSKAVIKWRHSSGYHPHSIHCCGTYLLLGLLTQKYANPFYNNKRLQWLPSTMDRRMSLSSLHASSAGFLFLDDLFWWWDKMTHWFTNCPMVDL